MPQYHAIAPHVLPLGTWSQTGAPEVIDVLGNCGFDFVILDAQHTSLTMQTQENMVQACDPGAAAFVVPGISTREAAEAAVRAARFGPGGQRSACAMVRPAGPFDLAVAIGHGNDMRHFPRDALDCGKLSSSACQFPEFPPCRCLSKL